MGDTIAGMEHEEQARDLFIEQLSQDAAHVLETEQANRYIARLRTMLSEVHTDDGKRRLADYGMEMIADEDDHALASFFFVLSALRAYSHEARDFFTDVMVHCEDRHGPQEGADALRRTYVQTVRPAL